MIVLFPNAITRSWTNEKLIANEDFVQRSARRQVRNHCVIVANDLVRKLQKRKRIREKSSFIVPIQIGLKTKVVASSNGSSKFKINKYF